MNDFPVCRYCDRAFTFQPPVVTHSYWNGEKFLCHSGCKVAGEKQEAFDCQVIDADCNDCKHFLRRRMAEIQREMTKTIRGEWVEITFQPQVWHGHCQKFNRPTTASPNKWTGLECFEHRRATKQ